MTAHMFYGGSQIRPVPMLTIGKQFQKVQAGVPVGTVYNVGLRGNIVEVGGTGSLISVMNDIQNIRNIFNQDGKYFKLDCDGTILFEGYPRIESEIQFSESPDNWVFTCPYSLTLQFDLEPVNIGIAGSGENTNLLAPYISSYDDTWSFEFDDSTAKYSIPSLADTNSVVIRATREVSAVGKSHYDGPGLTGTLTKPAWQYAEDFVTAKLGIAPALPLSSGVFNTGTSWHDYNHFRVQRISESNGTFAVTETFVLIDNTHAVIEDFQADIRSSLQDPYVSVTINGSVQGLEDRSYGSGPNTLTINSTKYTNASGYFETIKDTALILPRLQALVAPDNVILNGTPLTRVVGRSPTKGLINYSYEYNSRPSNCITGAKFETIIINDDNPTDVFSRIVVMGRPQGPIFNSFSTITDFRRNVSIDVVMIPVSGCTLAMYTGGNNPGGQVSNLLCIFENDLRNRYNKVYKERDTASWDPKNARYTRNVAWAAVDCTKVPPISLCSGA